MNAAIDAVRYARKDAFRSCPRASAFTQRSMLRHLCDVARPACEVAAYLDGDKPVRCTHADCTWTCFQSEAETSEDLSLSEDSVKRAREALVVEGWITARKTSSGRGAVWVYTISRISLEGVRRKRESGREVLGKGVVSKIKAELAKDGSLPTFEGDTTECQDGSLPTFDNVEVQKGRQTASERVADCLVKGGRLPLPILKNPSEPEGNPSAPLRVIRKGSAQVHREAKTYSQQYVVQQALIQAAASIPIVLPEWKGDAAGRLALLLRSVDQPTEFFLKCIANWQDSDTRFHSAVSYMDLIARLVQFQTGPKDSFGNVLARQTPRSVAHVQRTVVEAAEDQIRREREVLKQQSEERKAHDPAA